MLTAGVDLAAEPAGTALAVIHWAEGAATLIDLMVGMRDEQIIDATTKVSKLGIDCALGWPAGFVSFLKTYSADSVGADLGTIDGGLDWRRTMAYRQTDRHVRQVTGRWPLSVSTDRLGMTALRCAGLLSKLQHAGVPIDRSGAGKVVEVYPGAALRLWEFETKGYRQSAQIRESLVAALLRKAPWLGLGDFAGLMIDSCDAFDAVVAALSARAVTVGQYLAPTEQDLPLAKIEGWVALPTGTLNQLAKDD
ncbi:MAG: DUF429 domain-containing protein [Micrococcales bacterium]